MECPINIFSKIWNVAAFYLKYITYLIALTISSVITIPFMVLSARDVKNGMSPLPRNFPIIISCDNGIPEYVAKVCNFMMFNDWQKFASLSNSLFSQVLKHVTKILRITWYIRNKEVLLQDRAAVVVVNHQSAIDVLCLSMIWHLFGKMTTVAKKQLFYLGPFGLCCYMVGTIFIDRKSPEKAHKKLKKSSEILFKNKTKVLLFPEGTRNISANNILPFKKGAFNLAVDCQVPIIPMVISPYYFLNGKKRIFNKGRVLIHCLEAISTEGLTKDDVPELCDKIRNMMEIAYQKLSDEITKNQLSDNFLLKSDSNTVML